MTDEVAKRVSDLYDTKSKLLNDLSKVTDTTNKISISYERERPFIYWGGTLPLYRCNLYSEEIREFAIKQIKEQISIIDQELEKITCT